MRTLLKHGACRQHLSNSARGRPGLALGYGMNAGHDLNQQNLRTLIDAIPAIEEVSIGHALVCEALLDGFETTVRRYVAILGE